MYLRKQMSANALIKISPFVRQNQCRSNIRKALIGAGSVFHFEENVRQKY